MKDIKTLLQLNQQGFIPGPKESLEKFKERVSKLRSIIQEEICTVSGFSPLESIPLNDLSRAIKIQKHLFDINCSWTASFYSNKKLSLWQGAAFWVFETENSFLYPVIQLRKEFKKGTFLYFYNRDEVLAHEHAHAARMAFQESAFEEIFAYLTSKNPFRRFLGPLFFHSWESFCLLILCFLGTTASLLLPDFSFFFMFLPLLFVIFLFMRLFFCRICLSIVRKKIQPLVKDPSFCLPVLFRLTAKEIFSFVMLSKKEIVEYFHLMRKKQVRIWIICLAYFPKYLRRRKI